MPPPSYHEDLSVVDPRILRTGLSVLLRGAWEHKRVFGWSFVSGIVFALLQVYSATVLGHVTDNLIVPAFENGRPGLGTIVSGAAIVFVIAVCRALAVAARRVFASLTQFALYADYRHRLNRQYTDLPLAWHRRHPTGQLLSNVNADVEAMWFVMAPFPFALGTVAMLIYAVISILSADVWLGLVALILIPSIIVINVAYQRVASPLVTRGQQLRAEVSQVAHESFDGAAVVKALGREGQETTRFAEASHRLRDALIRVGYVRGWFDPMMDALPSVGVVAVIAVGAWRIKAGAIDTGTLVQVSYLFTLMALPLRSIGWVLGDLPRLVVAGVVNRGEGLGRHQQLVRGPGRGRAHRGVVVVDLDEYGHDTYIGVGAVGGRDHRCQCPPELIDRRGPRTLEIAAVDDVGCAYAGVGVTRRDPPGR